MKKYTYFFMVIFFLFGTSLWAFEPYSFLQEDKKNQFDHLLRNLRCLVCQNQDLADSNAALADDLRKEVYTLVIEGHSNQEIMDYLTARYGDFILFKPRLTAATWLLWFGPLLFIIMGLAIFGCVVWRGKKA